MLQLSSAQRLLQHKPAANTLPLKYSKRHRLVQLTLTCCARDCELVTVVTADSTAKPNALTQHASLTQAHRR